MRPGTRTAISAIAAAACFMVGCCSGLVGCVSLLAEHPDPKTGRIVGAEQSPYIFGAGVVIMLAIWGLGVYFLIRAIKAGKAHQEE